MVGRLGISYYRIDSNANPSRFSTIIAPKFCISAQRAIAHPYVKPDGRRLRPLACANSRIRQIVRPTWSVVEFGQSDQRDGRTNRSRTKPYRWASPEVSSAWDRCMRERMMRGVSYERSYKQARPCCGAFLWMRKCNTSTQLDLNMQFL